MKPSKYYFLSSHSIGSGVSDVKPQHIIVLPRGYYTNSAIVIAMNLTPLRMGEQISFFFISDLYILLFINVFINVLA